MKKYLAIALFVIVFGTKGAMAQVALPTNNPDKSAVLDMKAATNKGLLIPNVNLSTITDKSAIAGGNPAQSLLVYNTNAGITGTGAAGAGFYYWDINAWKKLVAGGDAALQGDNLGNHTATKGISLNDNSISNTGDNTNGLKFDGAGNAIMQQQLSIKQIQVTSNQTNKDSVLTADENGLIHKSFIDLSSIPLRYSYSIPALSAGTSGSVTTKSRSNNFMVTVIFANGCGRAATGVFYVAGNVITFLGGQSRDIMYTITVGDASGSSLILTSSTAPCQDGGGNATQFNFNIAISGKTITVTNMGNIAKAYALTVVEM